MTAETIEKGDIGYVLLALQGLYSRYLDYQNYKIKKLRPYADNIENFIKQTFLLMFTFYATNFRWDKQYFQTLAVLLINEKMYLFVYEL